jgi:hypothetical protein
LVLRINEQNRGSYFCELCGASAMTWLKVWAQ